MGTPSAGRKRRLLLPAALALAGLLLAACSGGGAGQGGASATPDIVLTPVEAKYLPVVISSDLSIGPNRFLLGLINQEDNSQVIDAEIHLRFFLLEGQETLKVEMDARSIRVAKSYTHVHEDGTTEVHQAGETGAYVAEPNFDTPGRWGVEVTGTVDGEQIEAVRPVFSVNEHSAVANVGDPAPRSVQPILSDGIDIADLDTSSPPIPEMHDMTVATAVTSGKPSVVVFATPAFCQSQICGPTKEVVDQAFQAYKRRANFVHVEPYDVVRLRNAQCSSLFECRAPVVDEWGLRTEPWVFLVDKEGNIAARFEAIVTYDELEAALKALLQP